MEEAREATSDDLGAIAWVLDLVTEEQRVQRGGALFFRREAAGTAAEIANSVANGSGVVGTYDDVVLGYGVAVVETLADGSLLGRIDVLAVVSEARKAGVGEAMMNLMLKRLGDAGCFGVDASALPGDRHTKNFFESFGLKARLLTVHKQLG